MYSYIVEGGTRLQGEVDISGSKNATLPILAASILNRDIINLYNVPNIEDVKTTLKILEHLNCKIRKVNNKIVVDSRNMKNTSIPEELMRKLRSSVILAGAILSRFDLVEFSYPGGCDIGARPIDLHLNSFKKLGIKIEEENGKIKCIREKSNNTIIHLDFPSVGATENIILASVLLPNVQTIVENVAMEPEIVDLCSFLNKLGAKIDGAGTSIIKINGVSKFKKGISYNIMPDRIEAGTFLVAAAITKGDIIINKVNPDDLKAVIFKLEECGAKIKTNKTSIHLKMDIRAKPIEIKTMPYPGFPTDMQAIFTSLLCTAKGISVVTENIFENRFKYIGELRRMGAKIKQNDKTIIIYGKRRLLGANVLSTDLRGGASLVLAALASKGESKISNLEYLLRGYDNLDTKLNKLGANIRRYYEDY